MPFTLEHRSFSSGMFHLHGCDIRRTMIIEEIKESLFNAKIFYTKKDEFSVKEKKQHKAINRNKIEIASSDDQRASLQITKQLQAK